MLVDKAREYLDTPFHHQGRLKHVGIDCIGLLVGVAQELGLSHGDLAGYSRYPDGVTLCRELDKYQYRIPLERAQPGDVVVFWIRRPTMPTHAGFLTDYRHNLGLIHTWQATRRVVEHAFDERWRKRVTCVYAHQGVEPAWRP